MVKRKKPEGRMVTHSQVIMSQVMLPHHAGPGGKSVHGGEIMKLMDTAAGVAALRHAHTNVATARVEEVNFCHPVKVGNYAVATARLTFVSRSSMEVEVIVETEDLKTEKKWLALTAYFVVVSLNDEGTAVEVPPLILSTEEEKERWEQGRQRYETYKTKPFCKI